jgi:hypothetical protein
MESEMSKEWGIKNYEVLSILFLLFLFACYLPKEKKPTVGKKWYKVNNGTSGWAPKCSTIQFRPFGVYLEDCYLGSNKIGTIYNPTNVVEVIE